MRTIASLTFLAFAWVLSAAPQTSPAQENSAPQFSDPIEVSLTKFSPPSDEQKKQVEQWLLELDLVPLIADRIAFIASGTFFIGGNTEEEKHIAILRQYVMGWSLDNRQDRERLLMINQPLLNPDVVDQGKWRMMRSDSSQLDQLRIKTTYHEANGSILFQPAPKSHIAESLSGSNAFFPTRAATSSAMSSWSGSSMDRSKSLATIDKLVGIQKVGAHTVALFEFRSAPEFAYWIVLAFRDGLPEQFEGWRIFLPLRDTENEPPTPEEIEAENKRIRAGAKRVALTQALWKKLGDHSVPVRIHGVNMNDFHNVEMTAEIEWFVNDRVNPVSFEPESVQKLGPFGVTQQ